MGSAIKTSFLRAIPLAVAQWYAVWKGEVSSSKEVNLDEEEDSWMTPIIRSLIENDQLKTRRLVSKATRFAVIFGVLYRR